MRRESFVHRARGLWSLRDLWDFPIPHCSKCKIQMVRFRGKWCCKEHTNIDVASIENGFFPSVDGMLRRSRQIVTPTPLGDVFPNRAARRANA